MLPGVLVNNLQNNGLIVPASCNSASDCSNIETCTTDYTCVLKANVGCQYQSSFCNLTGSISILSPCSVWTNILTLNFAGFVSSFFTTCGQGPSGGQTVTAQTLLQNSTLVSMTVSQNTTFEGTPGNPTGPCAQVFGGPIFNCQTSSPVLPVGITMPMGIFCSNWNGVYGRIGIAPVPSLCNLTDDSVPTPNTFTASCWIYGSSSTAVTDIICNNAGPIGQSTTTNYGGVLNGGNIITFFLSLIGTGLLLIIALGINVGGFTVSAGSNPQGTKLAQTFGMGLLVFMPLYSEFNVWFVNGYLPSGLDGDVFSCASIPSTLPQCFTSGGPANIISILLIIGVFYALYIISQSGSSTAQ